MQRPTFTGQDEQDEWDKKEELYLSSTEGTIGYVSLDVVDDTVKALKLDGVEATEANIKAGSYLLSRPFVMATNGEISAQNEIVQTWFDYIKSAKGQEVIKSVGLILPD